MAYTSSKKKALQKRRRYLWLLKICVPAVLLLGASLWFVWQPFVRIQNIDIAGTQAIVSQHIQQKSEAFLLAKEVRIVPTDSIFFYDKASLHAELVETFARIDKLEIKTKWFQGLQIDIVERAGQYLYCTDHCLSVDAGGKIIAQASEVAGLREYRLTGPARHLGGQVLETDLFVRLNEFLDFLEPKGLQIDYVELGEYDVAILALTGGEKIIFRVSNNYEELYTNFTGLLENSDDFALRPEGGFVKPIAYINLRYIGEHFGHRVFFCLVGAECENNY